MMGSPHSHRVPDDCPVCGGELLLTRVGCPSCGAELAGEFSTCLFCRLDDAEMHVLSVFLASRGNLREVAKHLGVSYPTARARLTQVLVKLDLSGDADSPELTQEAILAGVAAGTIPPTEASKLIAAL